MYWKEEKMISFLYVYETDKFECFSHERGNGVEEKLLWWIHISENNTWMTARLSLSEKRLWSHKIAASKPAKHILKKPTIESWKIMLIFLTSIYLVKLLNNC